MDKIKEAINTNLDHMEVTTLKVSFTLFLLVLISLSVVNYLHVSGEFDRLKENARTNKLWVEDLHYINKLVELSFHT